MKKIFIDVGFTINHKCIYILLTNTILGVFNRKKIYFTLDNFSIVNLFDLNINKGKKSQVSFSNMILVLEIYIKMIIY